MKVALIYQDQLCNWLSPEGLGNDPDGRLTPFHKLGASLREHGIRAVLDSSDWDPETTIEIFLNSSKIRSKSRFKYIICLEPAQIDPLNHDKNYLNQFNLVFTWNDNLIDNKKFIKIYFPHDLSPNSFGGFDERYRFCCMIASNKSLRVFSKEDLYRERIRVIEWFEKYEPENFDLFGHDWNLPRWGHGPIGRIVRGIARRVGLKGGFLKTYKGKLREKKIALEKTKFSICFENVSNQPGYISEKIFDSMVYGCVPVYWGCNNIDQYVPSSCFIDFRKFKSVGCLFAFLQNITNNRYAEYQNEIRSFLTSEQFKVFRVDYFVQTITSNILRDLNFLD